jgi:hypothetical protein
LERLAGSKALAMRVRVAASGRLQPVAAFHFQPFERPLLMKADVQSQHFKSDHFAWF